MWWWTQMTASSRKFNNPTLHILAIEHSLPCHSLVSQHAQLQRCLWSSKISPQAVCWTLFEIPGLLDFLWWWGCLRVRSAIYTRRHRARKWSTVTSFERLPAPRIWGYLSPRRNSSIKDLLWATESFHSINLTEHPPSMYRERWQMECLSTIGYSDSWLFPQPSVNLMLS